MSDITLSAGVRQNLLSLQSTAALLTTTQNRLATGKKVTNAFDNPTSFFTSQSLTNRANSLSSLLDQVGQAQQTLQAANQGLTSITSLLQQGLSVAQQALQAAGPSTLSYGAITIRHSTAPESPMSFEAAGLNTRRSVLISALGRAWLAFCPEDERRAILRDIGGLAPRQEAALRAALEGGLRLHRRAAPHAHPRHGRADPRRRAHAG